MYSAFMEFGEVLVMGGTGFIGRHVCRALIDRGRLPRLLVREGSERNIPEDIRERCRVTPGDATVAESVENAAQGTEAIVNLVGIVRERPGAGITFDRLHVDVARHAVGAARVWGISRLIHVSALGAAPGRAPAYFDSKGRGEEVVRESGLDVTVVRPSLVFGPGDRLTGPLCAAAARLPVLPFPGRGMGRLQPVFVGDVARYVAAALDDSRTFGRTVELAGPEVLSWEEIVDRAAASAGRRPWKVRVPRALLRAGAAALSRFGSFPLSPGMVDMLAADWVAGEGFPPGEAGYPPVSLADYLLGRLREAPGVEGTGPSPPDDAKAGDAAGEIGRKAA